MVAFRERKIIFEDKCFGCTDIPPPPKEAAAVFRAGKSLTCLDFLFCLDAVGWFEK